LPELSQSASYQQAFEFVKRIEDAFFEEENGKSLARAAAAAVST